MEIMNQLNVLVMNQSIRQLILEILIQITILTYPIREENR